VSSPKAHWDQVYTTKLATELSWYQPHPWRSLDLIQTTGVAPTASILDVGGGDSTLVDHLVARGHHRVTVLDLSSAALQRARERLGRSADSVTWREANILTTDLARGRTDVWHDRAVFHFLTRPDERAAYIEQVRRAVRPGGHVIVATFAEDGPASCSGLPVERYSANRLHATFGKNFRLRMSARETHVTPSGADQHFTYCWCAFDPAAAAAA
jgi:2-polyprenyl-3-methyl-5-hydroxy-6-metoxy-1,4-benzoquinol methylase